MTTPATLYVEQIRAERDALIAQVARVEAMFAPGGAYAPCGQEVWSSCRHSECVGDVAWTCTCDPPRCPQCGTPLHLCGHRDPQRAQLDTEREGGS